MSQINDEAMLRSAIDAVRAGGDELLDALDELPSAVYVTDAQGVITHYNKACIALAGRTPVAGHDSWCVTWKLYTREGKFLPHEECPMAVAVKEKRPVRGAEAVAERPDGTRIDLIPYPTPLFDADGEMIGAINMLIDVTARKQAQALRVQAARCRRLIQSINDTRTADTLSAMAAEYEAQARAFERPN